MKLSNIRQKNSRAKSKSRKKYVLFEEKTKGLTSEEKAESKERFNTLGDIRRNSKKKYNKKEKEKYFDALSKKKEILLKINPDKNDKESYPYNIITKKINKNKENIKKLKDYPNNIKGVLGQALYNNQMNNTNYNEFIRYKPINDIFNEQSNIPTRKITIENNNTSLNISFNSKSDLMKKEKEKSENNDNLYNNYNIENELKVNADSIKSRKNETLIKSGKSISPIENKKEINNELVSDYFNVKSIDKNDKKNKNENIIMNKEFNTIEIIPKKNNVKKELIQIEKVENINIILNKKKDENNYIFKNEEEIWKFIKNKMSKEKEEEYNNNKLKYNYFTLVKKFQGKILYEIGLENNIEEINNILEKENVKVENEFVKLVTKKSLDKINNDNNSDDEIKILKIKNEEIIKENETLKNNISLMKETIKKLEEKINSLNEKLSSCENELISKQIIINQNEKEINELNIQIEKNKEEINEKSNQIKENNKIQNTFKNNIKIINNEYFDIINISKNKIKENKIIYLIETFSHEYKNIPLEKEEKKEIEIDKEINDIIKIDKKEEKKKEIKIEKEMDNINELEKKEEKKEIIITNNMKDKINIFNNKEEKEIKKEENIPNKIFLLNKEKEETKEEKMKREERMNKALQRIKKRRKLDEEKDKVKKSEKLKRLSKQLETQLQKGEGKKLYVDLEYEKELEEEKEENNEGEYN